MLCMYHDQLATFVLPHWHCGLGVTISLDWTTGLDYWTGLLDWTTGLDYWTGLLDSPKLQNTPRSVQNRS